MINIIQKQKHYLILFFGLIVGMCFYFVLSSLKLWQMQIYVISGLCGFYFLWGVWHHYLEKDFHIKIVLEYFLVSLIGALMLLSIIMRIRGGNL